MPLNESLEVMKILDVLRAKWDLNILWNKKLCLYYDVAIKLTCQGIYVYVIFI